MTAALIRAGVFLTFVALAIAAPRSTRLTRAFIAFFFVASLAAGLSQRDVWPFSGYPIFAEDALRYRESVWIEIRGVAADGSEFRLREDVYAPLATATVEKWIERHPERLADPAVRRFLLSRRTNRMILGPLAAGGTMLARRGIRDEEPAAIRVYRHNIDARMLVAEFR